MKEKVQLTAEKETLLITLYAKAVDYQSKQSILNDKWAADLMNTINYDFSKVAAFGSNSIVVVRAKQFDELTNAFIRSHRNAIVVYLGCGLDSRIFRIDPPPSVTWYDVDYPEVIELRKTLYSSRKEYHMIASSVTATGWLEQIPGNRPTLIIAEGLVEYLAESNVQTLLNQLTDHFSHGQIVFDVMNSFAIRSGKEKLRSVTGAVHSWAVDDVTQVDRLNPAMKRINNFPSITSPFISKLPFKLRFSLRLMGLFSTFKYMVQILQYEF